MATVIAFPGGRQTSTTEGVNPELEALLAEDRLLLRALSTSALVQYHKQQPQPPLTSIWRPERPLTVDVRGRLHDAWYTGLQHAKLAMELVGVAGALAESEAEANGVHWRDRRQTELQALTQLVCQREVWRQFHLAPRTREGLAWKRENLVLLKDQPAGKLIIAADEAWMEAINGAIRRGGRSRGKGAS